MTAPLRPTSEATFPAVANADTCVLILGNLPGEESRRRAEYYAHPRNQFWKLMEAVIEVKLVGTPYSERLNTLLTAGVGLWNVSRLTRRVGSLDADILDHTPNDLGVFAATLPSLRALTFNGAKPFAVGRKQLGHASAYPLVALPSSSSAYCSLSFERKQSEWKRLRAFLN